LPKCGLPPCSKPLTLGMLPTLGALPYMNKSRKNLIKFFSFLCYSCCSLNLHGFHTCSSPKIVFVTIPNCTPVTIGVHYMWLAQLVSFTFLCAKKEDDAEIMKLFRKVSQIFEKKKTFTSSLTSWDFALLGKGLQILLPLVEIKP